MKFDGQNQNQRGQESPETNDLALPVPSEVAAGQHEVGVDLFEEWLEIELAELEQRHADFVTTKSTCNYFSR